MTEEQILKKAYDEAKDNGWDERAYLVATTFLLERGLVSHTYRIFLFSHSFAKAFWGEEDYSIIGKKEKGKEYNTQIPTFQKAWQYHLQQMVLEEEPLKYLEKFL